MVVDEATITFEQEDGFPLYAVIGKRTQPFGAFYERLVTDPPAKDAYEANQVGITVGYKSKAWWGLDASFTAYRQEELMDHFFGSTLFDNVNHRPRELRSGSPIRPTTSSRSSGR